VRRRWRVRATKATAPTAARENDKTRERQNDRTRTERENERAEEFFQMTRFHDFEMPSITGEPVEFSSYRDQVCLVVNVASE